MKAPVEYKLTEEEQVWEYMKDPTPLNKRRCNNCKHYVQGIHRPDVCYSCMQYFSNNFENSGTSSNPKEYKGCYTCKNQYKVLRHCELCCFADHFKMNWEPKTP